MSNSLTVLRHSLTVRLTHWLVAISGILLVFSGFGEMPMYKRYNVVKLPGMAWTSDFNTMLIIHYVAAVVFTASVVFHIIYHIRRKEFAAVPQKGDTKESIQIIKAMLTGKEEPANGKFLAEQRLAYAAIGGVSIILVITGLIKVYKNIGVIILSPTLIKVVTLAHTAATMLFLILFIAHLGAFAVKANWPLLPSMFSGKVKREYAKQRHQKWKIN